MAWSLPEQIPIYLYSVDGDEVERVSPTQYVQNWNESSGWITKIGPPLREGVLPYRLLWSAEQTMRFRPLVDRGTSEASSLVPAAMRAARSDACSGVTPWTQNDRRKEDIDASYYNVDPWNGLHQEW